MNAEIHITVDKCNNIEQFKTDCLDLGLKPIVIELKNQIQESQQVMTSGKYSNVDNEQIINKANQLYCLLQFDKKYTVSRLKIEKKPEEIKSINFKYYETHFRLKLDKNFDTTNLKQECINQNFHFSKNLFKTSDLYDFQMITYRTKEGDLSQFNEVVNKMKYTLNRMCIDFDKIEIEECILDTNEQLDKNWLNN